MHYLKDNDIIITTERIKANDFIQLCYALYIIVEKNVIPIEFNDLFISVKRKLKGIDFSKEDIMLGCEVVNSIELSGNGYFISFENLSTSNDMAYRVLFENKESMKLAEICKEINHRIINTSKKRVDKNSLNNQMNSDSRLVPLGKTGYWTIKEWNEVNKTMYELITDTLILFNKPLSKKEIFAHILKYRPNISTRSLDTILYNKRYVKIKTNKFILSEWKDLHRNDIVILKARNIISKENPISLQIKDQIVNIFLSNNTTEILLSTIVKTLNKNYGFPKASIYREISENNEFTTSLISKSKKIVMYKTLKNREQKITKSTSVFVSYCWESNSHKDLVISFVDFLRNQGFEADMDVKFMQEETAIDFNRLMHKGILKYDKVIIILSRSYKTKSENFEGGVGKEYRFIIGDIDKHPQKYILTTFESITQQVIDDITPLELVGREIVDLTKDELNNFQTLFSKLTDTGIYKFSDVAKNTPLVEIKKIEPFSLKK